MAKTLSAKKLLEYQSAARTRAGTSLQKKGNYAKKIIDLYTFLSFAIRHNIFNARFVI